MASKATTGPSVSSPGSHHTADLKKHGSIERMWGREQRSPSVLRPACVRLKVIHTVVNWIWVARLHACLVAHLFGVFVASAPHS